MQYGANYVGRNFKLIRPHHVSATETFMAGLSGVSKAADEKNTLILLEFQIGEPRRAAKAWVNENNVKLDDSPAERGTVTEQSPAPERKLKTLREYLPTLTEVKSSNIKAVGLADDGLVVAFTNGIGYHYAGVTEADLTEMLGAESVGKYFNANIKGNSTFESKKLEA